VAAAVAYCTPEGAAQIRPADGLMHNHYPNARGFMKFFNMVFCNGLHISYIKLFFLLCVLPFVLTV